MSTWWYLECLDHDPPIKSSDEVEQHTYGLPAIREFILRGPTWENLLDTATYFEGHAAVFIGQHPKCRVQFVSEYGDTEPLKEDATT